MRLSALRRAGHSGCWGRQASGRIAGACALPAGAVTWACTAKARLSSHTQAADRSVLVQQKRGSGCQRAGIYEPRDARLQCRWHNIKKGPEKAPDVTGTQVAGALPAVRAAE